MTGPLNEAHLPFNFIITNGFNSNQGSVFTHVHNIVSYARKHDGQSLTLHNLPIDDAYSNQSLWRMQQNQQHLEDQL